MPPKDLQRERLQDMALLDVWCTALGWSVKTTSSLGSMVYHPWLVRLNEQTNKQTHSVDTPVLNTLTPTAIQRQRWYHITTCHRKTHRPSTYTFTLPPVFEWHTGLRECHITTCHPKTHRPPSVSWGDGVPYWHLPSIDTPASDIDMCGVPPIDTPAPDNVLQITCCAYITTCHGKTHRPSTFTHNDNDVTSYMTYMTTRNAKTHRPPTTSYAFILPPFILRHTGLRRPNVPPHITTSHPKTHLHITGA